MYEVLCLSLIISVSIPPEPWEESKDDKSQHCTQNGRRVSPKARCNAHRGSEPEAGRRGQALNLFLLIPFENSPSAEKPNTSEDPLKDTAEIRELHPSPVWDQDEERGS